jgi:hypothetical protein
MVAEELNIISRIYRYWWDNSIETSSYPPIRSSEVSFIHLYRKRGLSKALVGSFVPELYLLANSTNGSLRCQIEERAWIASRQQKHQSFDDKTLAREKPEIYASLYRNDGKRKSPFELAVLPCHKLADIEYFVTAEYKYRRKLNLPLPYPVSRLRIIPEYLQPDAQGNLGDSGLIIGNSLKEGPNAININLWNIKVATSREKILHYIFQWAAFLATFTLALGAIETAVSPVGMVGIFAATFLATICAKVCSMYDISERTFRDLEWLLSADFYSSKAKLSTENTLFTLAKSAAMGLVLYGVVTSTFTSIMNLPWLVPTFALGTGQIAQLGLAGFLSLTTGVATWVGLSFTMRYVLGLSIYNNYIDVSKAMGNALEPIRKEDSSIGQQETPKAVLRQFRRKDPIDNPPIAKFQERAERSLRRRI